jgi:hypothetical protein
MRHISPPQFTRALSKQKSLSDAQWLQRCDELAEQQPVMFFELLTFPRDGVPADISRSLIDYLSVLQVISRTISETAAAPVSMPEFRASIKRTMQFFHALSTDDRPHMERMMKAWHEGIVGGGEPVIWAGCIEILRLPEVMAHPLFTAIVATLCGICDVYASRLQKEFESNK